MQPDSYRDRKPGPDLATLENTEVLERARRNNPRLAECLDSIALGAALGAYSIDNNKRAASAAKEAM